MKTHGWVTRMKPYSGDCAYANGFPVLAKGLDAVTRRTLATNDIMSFGEEGRGGRFVWVVVWGLNPEWLGGVGWTALRLKMGESLWLKASITGMTGVAGHAPYFYHTLGFELQTRKSYKISHFSVLRVVLVVNYLMVKCVWHAERT
jgi:hypothetical protein